MDKELWAAVQGDDIEALRVLIPGGDVNSVNKKKMSLLQSAAYEGYSEIVKYLLEHGANANYQDGEQKRTALHWAVLTGDVDAVEMLLPKTNVEIADKTGQTVLHLAVAAGVDSIFDLLITPCTSTVNMADKNGDGPLRFAMFKGNYAFAERLIEAGAQVNHRNVAGDSLLIQCSRENDLAGVKFLLRKSADANLANTETGDSPMHVAERERASEELITALSRAGAARDALNKAGRTPQDEAKAAQARAEAGEPEEEEEEEKAKDEPAPVASSSAKVSKRPAAAPSKASAAAKAEAAKAEMDRELADDVDRHSRAAAAARKNTKKPPTYTRNDLLKVALVAVLALVLALRFVYG